MASSQSSDSVFHVATPVPNLLVVLYLISTALHLYLLRNAFQFPHISSDEVQFAMTGENIRLGHGYTLRGQFNSTVPPVFPLFIAFAHSVSTDPRAAMFVLSCFLMCSALFPVYSLGKVIGLDTDAATILGAASSLLPHTFYAATYMSEIVQYPAYLTTFYLAIRWLEDRTWMRDFVTGCAIGFLLLTKVQGSQFAGAFLISGIIVSLGSRSRRAGSFGHFVAHFGVVLLTAAAIEGAWTLYKSTHAAAVLGTYGRILAEQGLPYWTPRLAVSYLADFLLAPGLITAVLLFYWIRYNGNRGRTVFVLAVLGVQLIAVSTLDGGLTGWLRERLFMYALPVTAVLSAKGLTYFKQRQTLVAQCAFLVIPPLLIGAVMAYPFAVSSVIEVPWADAMGSLAGLLPFARIRLAIVSVIVSVVVTFILLRSSRNVAFLFGEYLILFYGVGFGSSSIAMGRWTARGLRNVSPIMGWLSDNHVRSGDRLLVAGRHSYFEDPALRAAPLDSILLDWTWRMGLDESAEWQIETIGRFDVRMIPTPKAIQDEARPNDYFLTVARFDALGVPSSHDDLRLYRLDRILSQAPLPRYVVHVPAARFHMEEGWRDTAAANSGLSAKTARSLVYAPHFGFVPGTYQVRFDMTNPAADLPSIEVIESEEKVLVRKNGVRAENSALFAHHSDGPLVFRVFGDLSNGFHFDGIDLQWVSDSAQPSAGPKAGFVPDGGFRKAEPKDLLYPRAPNDGACYVDVINDAPPARLLSIHRQSGARIVGWVFNKDTRQVGEQVYIELFSTTGQLYWVKAHTYPRPDVAEALGDPALSGSGFTVSADLQSVAPSVYRMRIGLMDGSRVRECDPNRELDIR